MVHPTAVIEGDVQMGALVKVGPFCHLVGPLDLGEGVTLHSGVSIGACAEHRDHEMRNSDRLIKIGATTVVRENVVIHRGLSNGVGTSIGEECYIMAGAYLAHDTIVEKGVTISAGVKLAGHAVICQFANLGIGCMVHQFVVVGAVAMVGMGAVVLHHVIGGTTVVGVPARVIGVNRIGLERHGLRPDAVGVLRDGIRINPSDRELLYPAIYKYGHAEARLLRIWCRNKVERRVPVRSFGK